MDDQENIIKLQKKLRELLPPKRYAHTLGVQYTAASLAMRYGADIWPAQTAGLLHDNAKYLDDNSILSKCKKYGLPVSGLEERNPYLLHGKLGAYLAQRDYGITDKAILDAVIWHTTGRPDMELLEKIIFTADYMEPGRKEIPGLSLVRSRAFINLDETVFLILKHTLDYLNTDRKKEIDPMTKKAYDYYINKMNERECKSI